RLAMRAAQAVRVSRPELPVCFYGLYAPVSADITLGRLADRLIAGEYEPSLVDWASSLDGGSTTDLGRYGFRVPARDLLPRHERARVHERRDPRAPRQGSHRRGGRARHSASA